MFINKWPFNNNINIIYKQKVFLKDILFKLKLIISVFYKPF
jgi:hypothetical protein